FFFSSRRRHTRSKRDWSSDVCSSDLIGIGAIEEVVDTGRQGQPLGDLTAREGEIRQPVAGGMAAAERLPLARVLELEARQEPPRSEERRVGKECRSRWWVVECSENSV